MENKEMKLIVKIMGIVAAAFCGIALLVPWAGLGFGGLGIGIYPWGMSANIPGLLEGWDIFFINALGSGVEQSIVSGICMIIAFVITIIALIIGILGAKNLGVKKSNSFLIAGILSIAAIILCVIAISQIGGSTQGLGLGIGLGYGAGFFLIIIAMILYFVSFGLQKVFVSAPAPAVTQPMYQQPMQTQAPAQYYAQQPETPPPPPPQKQPQAPPPPVQPTTPQVKTGAKFCPACGAKVVGKPKFCNECGNKLA